MLRNSFLTLSARHYAFSRWLMARQPVTLREPMLSDHIPFIPPMIGRPEGYDLPVAEQDLNPDRATDDFALAVGGEREGIEGADGEGGEADDFVVLGDPSFPQDRFIVNDVPPTESSMPTRRPSVGQTHQEALPRIAPAPPRANDIRRPALPSTAAAQDVAFPSMRTEANDVHGAAGAMTRAPDRTSATDPPRAPDSRGEREQPIVSPPALGQPEPLSDMLGDDRAGEITDQPVYDDGRDFAGRSDTPQRTGDAAPVTLADVPVLMPQAADAQRAAPNAVSDADPSTVPSRHDGMAEERPRDQPRTLDEQRVDDQHDDATRLHPSDVSVSYPLPPQAQTEATATRVDTRPAVSATPIPPAARTRWQEVRRAIQQRLKRSVPPLSPNVQAAAINDASAPHQRDTASRPSGPASDRPALSQTLATSPVEAPTERSASPAAMPNRGDVSAPPATMSEDVPNVVSDAATPRIIPPRLSDHTTQALPAQLPDDSPILAALDAPTVRPAVSERTASNAAQTREGIPAEATIQGDAAQPFTTMEIGIESAISEPQAATTVSGTTGASDHAASNPPSTRYEAVNSTETTIAREVRSLGAEETSAPMRSVERATDSAAPSRQEPSDIRQTEDQPPPPAVRLSLRDQPPPDQSVPQPEAHPAQPLPPPRDGRDAGRSASPLAVERQEIRSTIAAPLPVQPRADAPAASSPSVTSPVTQATVQPVAPIQGAPHRPFIAPSQPIRPRPTVALPRAARTIAAWLKPRQTVEETPPRAEQPAVPPPLLQPVESAPRTTPDQVATQPQATAAMTVDPPMMGESDSVDLPSLPHTVRAGSSITDRQPDAAMSSAAPPRVDASLTVPIGDTPPNAPGIAVALPDVREQPMRTLGHAETTGDRQADERSAATLPTGDIMPEGQAATALNASLPVGPVGHPPREEEPIVVTPADSPSLAPQSGDSTKPRQSAPLVATAIAIEQPAQIQSRSEEAGDRAAVREIAIEQPSESLSRLDSQGSTTPVLRQPDDSQPAAASQPQQTAAVPEGIGHPDGAATRQIEPIAGTVAEVRSASSGEVTAPNPPIASPPHATLPVDIRSVDAQPAVRQPSGTTHDVDRSERTETGQTPDISPPAVSQSTVAPPTSASSAPVGLSLSPEAAEASLDRGEVNDILPRDRVETARSLVAEKPESQSRPSARIMPQSLDEPQSAVKDEPTRAPVAPDTFAAQEAITRPEMPVEKVIQPERALPPMAAATGDSLPPSASPIPRSSGDRSALYQASASEPLTDLAPPAIALPAQRAAVTSAETVRPETERLRSVEPAAAAVAEVPIPQPDSTTAPMPDIRQASIPVPASDESAQPPPDLMQLARAIQQAHIPSAPSVPGERQREDVAADMSAAPGPNGEERILPVVEPDVFAASGPHAVHANTVRNGDTTQPLSEPTATRQPMAVPAAEPADRAVHAESPALVASDAQTAAGASPVATDDAPPASPHSPTVALDPAIESPAAAPISTPTAQPPEPVSPIVIDMTPGDTIPDEPTEQPLPEFIEVRQARRRPILPAPAPPVEAPAPSEAELEMERV
ncbi:MAG TPA: hypothetical protein VIG44_05460, partial [Thermomicrobiales bacterium]